MKPDTAKKLGRRAAGTYGRIGGPKSQKRIASKAVRRARKKELCDMPDTPPRPDIRITVPFPPDLYDTICTLADTDLRSFGRQVVYLVKKALEKDKPDAG